MTKAFAFDIDGTFITSDHKVQQSHIDALIKAKEAGHHLILCSGRPYFDMVPVIDQVPEGMFEWLICNNGAYVMHLPTKRKYMENEVSHSIIKDFENLRNIAKFGFAVHTLNFVQRGVFWNKEDEAPKWFLVNNENMPEKSKYFKTWEETKKMLEGERVAQLSLIGDKEDIQKAQDEIMKNPHDVDIHIAGEIYLDVNPDNVSKLKGIEDLSELINVPVENFVAFGDSGNDIQMLSGAGLGIAMGNATQEAKNAADIVIGNNDTSALADEVLKLI